MTEPEDIPMIVYWCGEPLSDMPREELEREFVAAHHEIQKLNERIAEMSVRHIQDLGILARRG